MVGQGRRQSGGSQPTPTANNESAVAEAVVPVTADMLHVSSILLGNSRLAIVSGELVKEGDSFNVKTPGGAVVLRVVKIEDGVVHFKNGGQIIDARLIAPVSGH